MSADRSLLLDYVTPFQIISFIRSVKFGHFSVTSTILIFVLIKVLTVISTGLLTLDIIPFENVSQTMRTTSAFDGSEGLDPTTIDSRASVGLYGHRVYGMLLPNGTTEKYAFQLFEPAGTSKVPRGTYAYNSSVDVFLGDGWTCETGNLTYKNGTDHMDVGDGFGFENSPVMMYYNASISLPDCEIHKVHLDAPDWYYQTNDTTDRFGYYSAFQQVNCSNLPPTDPKFKRFTVSTAYSIGTGQDDHRMLNSSHIVCIPSYKIQSGYVQLGTDGQLLSDIALHGPSKQIDGITASDIAIAVQKTVAQGNIPSDIDTYKLKSDTFTEMMISLSTDFKFEDLMNRTWLETKSKEAYQQLSAQIAGLYLLTDKGTTSNLQGTISQNVNRLVVRELPTRLMQAIAAVMFLLTITMVFTMPHGVVPRSVESIAGVAAILARSPALNQILRNTGHLDIKQLSQVLAGHRYMSTVADAPGGRTFSIRVLSNTDMAARPPAKRDSIKWATPLVLHRVVMLLTLLLAIAVVITLEVLYQKSQASSGIANVNVDSLEKYSWLYVPTVVLVLLATTFNLLDFELEFSDPYHELARRGYASAESSLLWDPLRNVSVRTTFQAFRHSRFALVASSLCAIVAPMLTILVSGLFTTKFVPLSSPITAKALTWFNISSADLYADAYTFAIPSLIVQGNMSYPRWTYDEIAFPSIDLSSQTTGIKNATSGTITLNMPAARGVVNCTIVPESAYLNMTPAVGMCTDSGCIEYNISDPSGCGNTGYIDQNYIFLSGYASSPLSGSGYFGSITAGASSQTNVTDNSTIKCPPYTVYYGKMTDGKVDQISFYRCFCALETIQTTADISLFQSTIINEPTVMANTSKIFNDEWYPSVSDGPYYSSINFTHPDEYFGAYVNAMVYGRDGVPKDELLDNTKFIDRFTRLYRIWTAQWMNTYMRNPIDKLPSNQTGIPNTLTGVYDDPNRNRLFLTTISTRALEGVIGMLLICGIVIFVLVDMSKVLPKEVGTIGAVASLLAGSRLVDEKSGLIPRGSEWISDNEMMKRGMFKGERFRMGWWTDDISREDRNIDTTYRGNVGELYGHQLEKEAGEFRIDARPRSDISEFK